MKTKLKTGLAFLVAGLLLAGIFIWSFQSGTITLDPLTIIRGLLLHDNQQVEVIRDLRLPRLFIAVLVGINLPLATALLQVVTKNSLADPGLLGISSGANLAYYLVLFLMPEFFLTRSLFICLGGLVTGGLLLIIARRQKFQPLQLIISGVALQAMLTSINNLLSEKFSSTSAGAGPSLGLKTWSDVRLLFFGSLLFILLAFFSARWCDLFQIDETNLRQLAVPVTRIRLFLFVIAICLASLTVASVGVLVFLGLLSVHISRLIIGLRYQVLLPFSALVGAILLLTADTIGRTWFLPLEVSASQILAIIGAPCLIFLLLKGDAA